MSQAEIYDFLKKYPYQKFTAVQIKLEMECKGLDPPNICSVHRALGSLIMLDDVHKTGSNFIYHPTDMDKIYKESQTLPIPNKKRWSFWKKIF